MRECFELMKSKEKEGKKEGEGLRSEAEEEGSMVIF